MTISILRTIFSFLILMLFALSFGKQVNSHSNQYNFALSVIIGSFIANMAFDIKLKFLPMLSSFLTLIFIYFIFSIISSKSRWLRKWLAGKPTVVIEKGKILDHNIKKMRYTLDDLNQQLREIGIFDIIEVEYAVLEVSGNLSILKKSKYQNATKQDINPTIQNEDLSLPKELVMDRKMIEKNFTSQYSKYWFNEQLKQRHLHIKDIQYGVISSNGTLFIDVYQDHLNSPTDLD